MNNPMDMRSMLNMLRQNPMQFLAQGGFNVPGNLAANPNHTYSGHLSIETY